MRSAHSPSPQEPEPAHWHERRLGRTILRARRDSVDLYDVLPNESSREWVRRRIQNSSGRSRPTKASSNRCCLNHIRAMRLSSASSTVIADGPTRKFWLRFTRRSSTVRCLLKLLTIRLPMRNGCVYGFTSTGSAKNGTPRKRKWWPTASSTWS
jgi:hypothetical protein